MASSGRSNITSPTVSGGIRKNQEKYRDPRPRPRSCQCQPKHFARKVWGIQNSTCVHSPKQRLKFVNPNHIPIVTKERRISALVSSPQGGRMSKSSEKKTSSVSRPALAFRPRRSPLKSPSQFRTKSCGQVAKDKSRHQSLVREQDLRRLMSDIQRILSEETRNVSSTVLETFRNTMQYLKSEETIRRGRTPLEQHTHRFLRDCSRPFMDAVRRRTPFPDPTDKAQDPQLLGARKLSDSSNSPIPQGRCAVEVAPISDVLCYPKHALDLSDSGDDLPKCDDNGEDEDDSSVSSEDSFELWDQKMAAADMHKAEDSSVFSPASDLSDGEDFKPSVKRSTATTPARLSRTYCIRSAKLLKSIEMDDFERERSVIPEIPGTPCPASSWRNFDPSNDHRPHSPFAQTPCSASRFSKPSPQKTPSSTNSVSIGPRSSEPAIETASTRSIQRCSVVEVSTGSQPKTPKERILKRYYVSPESQYKASPPTSHRNGSKAPKLKLKVSSSASCKLQSVIDLSHNTPSETPSRPRRPRAASRQPQLSWNIEESIVIPHASIPDTSFALSGEEGNLSASRSRHSVSEKSLPPEPIVKKSRTILDTILFPRNSIPHPVVKLPRPGVSAARQKRKKPSPAGSKAQSRRQIRAVELAELAKDLSSSLCENIERVFDQR